MIALPPTPPTYECLIAEASRQALPPSLLLAVMKTEGGRVGGFARNRNGTVDIGPMQINSSWIPTIAATMRAGQDQVASTIAYDGCVNVAIGAWILRRSINEAGETWKGVAYYNSHNAQFGYPYAWRVYRNLQTIYAKYGRPNAASARVTVAPETTPRVSVTEATSVVPGGTAVQARLTESQAVASIEAKLESRQAGASEGSAAKTASGPVNGAGKPVISASSRQDLLVPELRVATASISPTKAH